MSNSRWHPKTDREKRLVKERNVKIIRFMIGLALVAVVFKYLMTGCIVVCGDWNDDEVYFDKPIESTGVRG